MPPKSRWTLKNKPLQKNLNVLQSIKDLQLLVDMTNFDDSPGSSDGEVAFEEAHVPAPTRESVPAVVVQDCPKKIKCEYCNKHVLGARGLEKHQSDNKKCKQQQDLVNARRAQVQAEHALALVEEEN